MTVPRRGRPLPSPGHSTRKTTKKKSTAAAFWVLLYAIAVGITPEFDFMGIPKVRITDLLLPVILLTSLSSKRAPGERGRGLPLSGAFMFLFSWNIGALFVWGKAALTPGLFYLAKRLIYFIVVYSVYLAVRDVQSWNRIIRMVVFTSPLLSLSVLHELHSNINSGGILATGEGMRASGIIANQQTSTALYIAVITCIALGAWDAFTDARWRLGTSVSLATGCAAIFATGSRGGLACVVLSLLATIFQNPRRGCSLILVGIFAGGIAWITTPKELQTRLSGLLPETQATISGMTEDGEELPEYGTSSVADRVMMARNALNYIIPQAPVLGLGAGFKRLGAIDDFYLTEWVYHGIIGLGLWIYLQLGVTVGCWRISKQSKDRVERGVAAGATSAMLVLSASGIQGDCFYLIRPMEALSLLLGLVAARREMAQCESTT